MKRTLALFLCMLFVVSLCACGGEAWPTTGLGAMLPKPSSGTVKSVNDYGDRFSATVENISDNEFDSYVSACKEKGFTIDADESFGYEAFNEEGYKLSVTEYSSLKDLNIDLDKPIELGSYNWPDSALGKAVPKPSSEKGKVETDKEDCFVVYVGDMSIDDFNDYADTCKEAGFNVDYDRDDTYYCAYDKDNNYINISYEGNNIVRIEAKLKEEEASDDDSSKSDSSKADSSSKSDSSKADSSKSDSGSVTPEFKEMMDEYEEFMDKYVEFMKKYKESDDITGMLSEYNELMSSYSEYMTKINDVDTDSLSEADLAYYTEVTGRVTKKLAEIGE